MLHFDKGVLILLSLVLLTLPLNWFLGWLLAVIFHEVCHIAMIHMLKGKILAIRVGIWGMQIVMDPLPPEKELLCALAGPIGSLLLLLLFFRTFPGMAVCAGVQALFNLLPVYPLDGGRVLRCILIRFCTNWEQVASWMEYVTFGILLAAMCVLRLRIYSVILSGIYIIKKISLQSAASRGTIVLNREITQKE